jgi:predicted nucleic acid-binding protein
MSSGFLLDTNVLSELMRSHPAQSVLDWYANNVPSTVIARIGAPNT